MTDKMPDESEALYNLKNNQQQLDMDGIMVGVSRQALEEVFDEIAALKAEHRSEMAGLCDEIIAFDRSPYRSKTLSEFIELIKQRISDE